MRDKIRILYIDDYELDRELVKDVLEKEHGGFEVVEASNRQEFKVMLKTKRVDAVLSDFNIAGFEGFQVIEAVREYDPDLPVIIVTGTGSEEIAVKALKQGAADYVIKRPKHIQRLAQTILAAIEKQTLRNQSRDAEISLKKSEKMYRSLFENMLNGYAYCRMIYERNEPKDFIYIDVNNAFEKLTGMKKVTGKKISELIPNIQETDPKLFEIYGRVAMTGIPEMFEMCIQALSMWFSVSVYSPEKEYFVAIFDVITERKLAEQELRETLQRLKFHVENSPLAVIEFNKDFQIILWSSKAEHLFGWSSEEIIGKRIDQLRWVHEDDLQSVAVLIDDMLTGRGTSNIHKNRNYCKDGSVVICEWYNSVLKDEAGNLISVQSLVLDITERENLQVQLIQAQKMESVGRLAGGVAHDFNNILFPIVGYTEMLLEDVPCDSPFKASLNQIHTSALRAKDLVKQILTFSRQDSSELTLMKIQPIVKEALKLIRSTIPTTIEIKQEINPDCGVIKADPTQIHQIVMNLATNAYHAMEETGGELKVSLKQMEFGTPDLINLNMKPGVYACLTVADTGKGMNKNLTDKIFDPFFTTKATGKGTGMGLSVVHGIVTAMGGAIHVYSEPGNGTEFHVYLPVEGSLSEEQAITSKIQIQGGTEQILLVDDEEAILTMEKRMLTRLGYQVTSRTSSLEALEIFRDSPYKFDLVITDMQMPNMPGDRLSAELTKIRPGISILLCTGFSEAMSEEKATSLGIKGFILKPIVMKDLFQKIREVLDVCKI